MIDLEKVLKGLECCSQMTGNACRQCPYDEECAEMIGSGSAHLCADTLALLKEQLEQKHGHWIPIKLPTGVGAFGYREYMVQEVTCSECKFTEDVSASAYLYCPNCGAKMDGKVKQDEQ